MFGVVFLLLALVYYSEADIQISGSEMIVKRVKSLKCSSNVDLSRYPGQMVAYHQWNQASGGGGRFVSLPAIEALNSEYAVELQKFDHNTNIYSSLSVYNASNRFQHVFNLTIHCSGAERKWISLVDDDYYQYHIDHIVTYADSKKVKFSCLQHLNLSINLLGTQIGWINTAGDRIFTYNQTKIVLTPADAHNGSMLCCLYYTTTAHKNGKHIQRFVKDITLLIYKKEMPIIESQPSDTNAVADTNNYEIIIVSSISAIMVLLLVGIYAIKKRCWKKTNRPERAQIQLPQIPGTRLQPANNAPDSNTPFYLNLLFRRECEYEIQAQEEQHYEEVM